MWHFKLANSCILDIWVCGWFNFSKIGNANGKTWKEWDAILVSSRQHKKLNLLIEFGNSVVTNFHFKV